MISEDENSHLKFLVEQSAITSEDKNLRSKIDSMSRSIENLESKQKRLEYEIKRQKKALLRKREELKRVSKRNSSKLKLKHESNTANPLYWDSYDPQELQRLDSRLLQESNQALDGDVL